MKLPKFFKTEKNDTTTTAISGGRNTTPSTATPEVAGRALSTPLPVVHNKELEELLLKLDLMEKECIQEKLVEEKEAIKDEFIALKREMYKHLMDTKDLIRSRHSIQVQKGNTVEVIQKGAQINDRLKDLDAKFAKMKDVFKRQVKQRGKKYSEELLDQRFKEMQLIKQQVAECKDLYKNAAMKTEEEVKTLTDFRTQMRHQGVSLPAPQEWRELNAEEQGAIDRWKARDEQIDVQIGEIGDAIDRLGEVALQIGEKADRQAELVAGLHQQADEANEELLTINSKIKELITKQGGMNLCCKLVLALILVALICFIITLVKKRIVY